jgi:hypothetical protein
LSIHGQHVAFVGEPVGFYSCELNLYLFCWCELNAEHDQLFHLIQLVSRKKSSFFVLSFVFLRFANSVFSGVIRYDVRGTIWANKFYSSPSILNDTSVTIMTLSIFNNDTDFLLVGFTDVLPAALVTVGSATSSAGACGTVTTTETSVEVANFFIAPGSCKKNFLFLGFFFFFFFFFVLFKKEKQKKKKKTFQFAITRCLFVVSLLL